MTLREIAAKAHYEFALRRSVDDSPVPWEKVTKGVREYHFAHVDAVLEALDEHGAFDA